MRNLVKATTLIASVSTAALAQTEDAKRPTAPAPAAIAPFEERETWCQLYTTWFVGAAPAATPAPADVRPTHRLEVEFNSCKIDPQKYERDTFAEMPRPETRG